jgi:hypothetical protein
MKLINNENLSTGPALAVDASVQKYRLAKGGLAALLLVGGIFGIGKAFTPSPEDIKKAANAKKETLSIVSPPDKSLYGLGKYTFEGVVPKEASVQGYIDHKAIGAVEADKDGNFQFEVPVTKPGKHTFVISYKGKDHKNILVKHEFKAGKGKNPAADKAVKVASSKPKSKKGYKDGPNGFLPEDDQSNVAYIPKNEPQKITPPPVKKKGTPSYHPADEVVTNEPMPTLAGAKKAAGKVGFVVSSHSNFNAVPTGVINFGGKGTPGHKVTVFIDGKPSMKGTIKPDGRWTFPISINTPGGRKLTAKDTTSGKTSTIKLNIK